MRKLGCMCGHSHEKHQDEKECWAIIKRKNGINERCLCKGYRRE